MDSSPGPLSPYPSQCNEYSTSALRSSLGLYRSHCNINDVRKSFAFEDKTTEAYWTFLDRREVDVAAWQYERLGFYP
jgi:hypothetical protein